MLGVTLTFNGEIDITVTGGTQAVPPPPYSFIWAWTSSFSSTSEDITNLGAGIYNVTVADDDNACVVSSSATVGTLTPINAGHYTWKGTTNDLWQISSNWDCGVPDNAAEVIMQLLQVEEIHLLFKILSTQMF